MKRSVHRRQKAGTLGGALSEFVLCLMAAPLLMGAILFFANGVLIRARVFQLARFGTLLQSCGLVDDNVVKQEVEKAAHELSIQHNVPIAWVVDRYDDTPASRFYDLSATRLRYQLLPHFGFPLFSGLPVIEVRAVAAKDKKT